MKGRGSVGWSHTRWADGFGSGEPEPSRKEVRSADVAAEAVGLSRSQYDRAKSIARDVEDDTRH